MSLARRSGLLSRDATRQARALDAQLEAQLEQELDKLRMRVATGIAARAVQRAEKEAQTNDLRTNVSNGGPVRAGVIVLLDRPERAPLMAHVVTCLVGCYNSSSSQDLGTNSEYLFAVAAGPLHKSHWPLTLIASSRRILTHAEVHLSLRFLGRLSLKHVTQETYRFHKCTVSVADSGAAAHDELLLWDIVRKAARFVQPAKDPPPGALSASSILAIARMRLERLTPGEALSELQSPELPVPVILVDIRPAAERAEHGRIDGALEIERSALEWTLDPRSMEGEKHALAGRYDLRVIVLCGDGRASSLASAGLHDLGLLNATDVDGGFGAWKAAGLPTCS